MSPLNNNAGPSGGPIVVDEIVLGADSSMRKVPSIESSTASEEKDSDSYRVPKLNATYGSKEYWEERFSVETDFEWLLSYQQLAAQLTNYLQPTDRILIVGCGNAPFSADLFDAGYHNIVNIDYSETVIQAMQKRHAESRPEMEWKVMDMTDMNELSDASFDVVIDKAAMDALMTKEGDVWNPDPHVVRVSREMCQHVSRILKPGGYFLQTSLAQPHFRKKYLLGWHDNDSIDKSDDTYSDEFGWSFKSEAAGGDSQAGCFGHFFYIMQKREQSE